jgi:hypothetical protein
MTSSYSGGFTLADGESHIHIRCSAFDEVDVHAYSGPNPCLFKQLTEREARELAASLVLAADAAGNYREKEAA